MGPACTRERQEGIAVVTRRRTVVLVAGLAAGVVFVILAVREVAWSDLGHAMRSARLFPWIPAGVASYLVGVTLRGWRLRLLVSQETRLPIVTASNVVAIGYALNNVLPGRVGELGRAHALTRQTSMSFAQALTVTALERVLDGLVMLFLFALTVAFGTTRFFDSDLASLLVNGLAIALFCGFAGLVAVATLFPYGFTRALSGAAGRVRPSWHDAVYAFCLHVTGGVAYLRRPAGAMQVVALSIGIWLIESFMFVAAFGAFALPLNGSLALLTMSVTNLGIAVPSTPGYIGTWHLFCSETLRLAGIDPSIALSYAIITHLCFFVPITVWGGAVLGLSGLGWSVARRAASGESRPGAAERFGYLAALPVAGEHKDVRGAARFYDALVDAMLPPDDLPLDDAARASAKEDVLRFIYGQLHALPNRVFVLYIAGIFCFRCATVLRFGRPFERVPLGPRIRWLAFWADGPFSLTRKLFRPLRSFVLLSYYEHPAVHRALDAYGEAMS